MKASVSYNLSDRLIEFSVSIIDFYETLPKTFVSIYLSRQLVRSGISPSLNYAEAIAAESRNDFIHKMKVCLKELRETYNCCQIIKRKMWGNQEMLLKIVDEAYQLIAIFVKSIDTARKNSHENRNS